MAGRILSDVQIGESGDEKDLVVTGALKGKEVRATGDASGEASTISLTNVNDAGVDTGVGTILLTGSGTTQNSAGFIKVKVGTQTVWLPYFDNIVGV